MSIGKRFVLIYTNVSFSIFSAKKLISLRFDNLNSWMYKFDKPDRTFASDLYLIQTLAFGCSLYLLENNQWRNLLVMKTIFYSIATLIRKILFSPLLNKIHIFVPPCNILYISDKDRLLVFYLLPLLSYLIVKSMKAVKYV